MTDGTEEMIYSKAFLLTFAAMIHFSQQRAPTGRVCSSSFFDDDRPWDDFGDYSDDVQVDELLWDDARHRHIYLDADGNWGHRDFDHGRGKSNDGYFRSRSRLDENKNLGESDSLPESGDDSDWESEEDKKSESPFMHLDASVKGEHVDWHHKWELSEGVRFDGLEY